jgi:hypothetical protein
VPAFDAVYVSLPAGSFHDSNIEHERGLARDAERLRAALSRDVRSRVAAATWRFSRVDMRLERDSVEIQRIRHTSDGRLLLAIVGTFRQAHTGPPHASGVFAESVEVHLDGREIVKAPGKPTLAGYTVSLTDVQGNALRGSTFQPPVSLIFPPPPGSLPIPPGPDGSMLLSVPTFRRLLRFYNAAEGDPSFASDRWLRMGYLSAVTVTTLGFGDITPVSGWARALVASEAILGIVVIGFFLNALASRLGRRRVTSGPSD